VKDEGNRLPEKATKSRGFCQGRSRLHSRAAFVRVEPEESPPWQDDYRLKAVKLMRLDLWSRAHELRQFGQFT